jgi:hypothetical protein
MTAVMARVVLKKVPSTQQLLGIAVVSAGLVHSGWGTLAKSGTEVRRGCCSQARWLHAVKRRWD